MRCYESAFSVAINPHPTSIGSARLMSHDTVIANTGDTRRSGVSWTEWWPAHDAQRQMNIDGLDVVIPDDVLAVIRAHPDGVLIVATVEIDV